MYPADELKLQSFKKQIENIVKGTSQVEIMMACLHDLYNLGRKIEKPENFTDKYAQALCTHWHKSGLKISTIDNRLSAIRKVSAHFGRVIRPLSFYLPSCEEELLCMRQTKHIQPVEIVLSADDIIKMVRAADAEDWRFGLMFRMHAFNMPKEDILSNFRPGVAVDGKYLRVQGCLLRIETAAQRQILDMVAALLPEEKLLWPLKRNGKTANKTYCDGRYTRLCSKIGMTANKIKYFRDHRKDIANAMATVIPPKLLQSEWQVPPNDFPIYISS